MTTNENWPEANDEWPEGLSFKERLEIFKEKSTQLSSELGGVKSALNSAEITETRLDGLKNVQKDTITEFDTLKDLIVKRGELSTRLGNLNNDLNERLAELEPVAEKDKGIAKQVEKIKAIRNDVTDLMGAFADDGKIGEFIDNATAKALLIAKDLTPILEKLDETRDGLNTARLLHRDAEVAHASINSKEPETDETLNKLHDRLNNAGKNNAKANALEAAFDKRYILKKPQIDELEGAAKDLLKSIKTKTGEVKASTQEIETKLIALEERVKDLDKVKVFTLSKIKKRWLAVALVTGVAITALSYDKISKMFNENGDKDKIEITNDQVHPAVKAAAEATVARSKAHIKAEQTKRLSGATSVSDIKNEMEQQQAAIEETIYRIFPSDGTNASGIGALLNKFGTVVIVSPDAYEDNLNNHTQMNLKHHADGSITAVITADSSRDQDVIGRETQEILNKTMDDIEAGKSFDLSEEEVLDDKDAYRFDHVQNRVVVIPDPDEKIVAPVITQEQNEQEPAII